MNLQLSSSDQVEYDEEQDELAEAQASGGISARVWYEYFHAGSTFLSFSFMVCIMLLSQVVCSSSDYFSNIWAQQEYQRSQGKPTSFTTYECMYIYGGLIIMVVVMTTFRGFLFFKICMHASKVLHDRMFSCILHAAMRFFDTNPSGRILNRFSKDMGAVDELLPRAMMDFVQIALVMFGILIVISVVNPVLIAAMLVVGVVDVLVMKLYLRPSQDLKRLEGICRSPVFSHLSSSLMGLPIIRSRQMQDVVAKEFDLLQDVHSSVWQLTMSANTALGLWLDCVSCAFLASVTFSFIISSESKFFNFFRVQIFPITFMFTFNSHLQWKRWPSHLTGYDSHGNGAVRSEAGGRISTANDECRACTAVHGTRAGVIGSQKGACPAVAHFG